MLLLLWLFKFKSITPGAFYRMPEGEKAIITAFAQYEVEQEQMR